MKTILSIIPLLMLIACSQYETTIDSIEPSQEAKAIQEDFEPKPDSIRVNIFETIRLSQSDISPLAPMSRNNERMTIDSIMGDDGYPLLYVINWEDDHGFLVTSGIKTAAPILAFNNHGRFSLNLDGTRRVMDILKSNVITTLDLPQDSIFINRLLWSFVENHTQETSSRSEPENGEDFDSWPNSLKEKFYASQSVMRDSISSWGFKNYYILQEHDNSQFISEKTGNQVSKTDVYDTAKNWCYWEFQTNYKPLSLVRFYSWDEIEYNPDPFVESKWGQGPRIEYNTSYPIIKDEYGNDMRAYAGCVPVAMGQIMRYYQWPSKYAWNNMPYYSATKTTSDFLYDIAQTGSATYKYNGTSMPVDNANKTFKKFGYKTSDVKELNNIMDLNSYVSTKKPVIVFGKGYDRQTNDDVYHAFVACGYNSYFVRNSMVLYTVTSPGVFKKVATWNLRNLFAENIYINWGWDGQDDGYYNSNYLTTKNYIFNYGYSYILPTPDK